MKTSIHLNNTALTRLYSCERLFQISCLWGYDESNEYVEFGKQFHRFAEGYNKTGTFDLLNWTTSGGSKDPQFLTTVMTYQGSYPPVSPLLDKDGDLLVEYPFCYPLLENETHILYATGTLDLLTVEDNCLVITDYKTSRNVKMKTVLEEYTDHLQLYWYLYHLKYHLAQFLLPEHAALIESGKFYGRYRGVFISFTVPKFEDSAPIELTSDVEEDIRRIINISAARIVTLHSYYQDNLAPPTGMSNNSCKNCWLQSYCRTKDHGKIKTLLSYKESTPYDPRTWR